jgi:hypothetical protein
MYVAGGFAGTVVFGAGGANPTPLISFADPDANPQNPDYDMFVAKHDRQGELLWVKQAGGLGGRVAGLGIDLDPSGNIVVAGSLAPQ